MAERFGREELLQPWMRHAQQQRTRAHETQQGERTWREVIKRSSRVHEECIKRSSRVHQEVTKRSSRGHQEVISGIERTAREPPSKSGPCGGGGAHPNTFESLEHLMREAIISGNQ